MRINATSATARRQGHHPTPGNHRITDQRPATSAKRPRSSTHWKFQRLSRMPFGWGLVAHLSIFQLDGHLLSLRKPLRTLRLTCATNSSSTGARKIRPSSLQSPNPKANSPTLETGHKTLHCALGTSPSSHGHLPHITHISKI